MGKMSSTMRYDYLTRFRADYTGGISRLLAHGAVFTNTNLEHYPTVTAVGHATMLSGATPSVSGIIGNDWFERGTGATVTSVSDPAVRPLGASTGSPASPRRLLVTTIGDGLKIAAGQARSARRVSACHWGVLEGSGRHSGGRPWR
jgi:predicted AlkP superfamily pyrophosphatase or phosphodiesterase